MDNSIEFLTNELKEKWLKNDEYRFNHSIGTMNMARKLAKMYRVDVEKAAKCGLMHDMAKDIPNDEKVKYATKNQIPVEREEYYRPTLLHGKVGADICKKQYGFSQEMCDSIWYHTTGRENMTLLDKIVFVSDKIEENTRKYEGVEEFRNLAYKDLNQTIVKLIDHVIEDKVKKEDIMLIESIKARNYILIN